MPETAARTSGEGGGGVLLTPFDIGGTISQPPLELLGQMAKLMKDGPADISQGLTRPNFDPLRLRRVELTMDRLTALRRLSTKRVARGLVEELDPNLACV